MPRNRRVQQQCSLLQVLALSRTAVDLLVDSPDRYAAALASDVQCNQQSTVNFCLSLIEQLLL